MSTQQENFKKIADKIREKTNTTAPIKPSDFATLIDDVYIMGKESADSSDSDFWDEYQQKGARTEYPYAFYGNGWNSKTFTPKYDFVISSISDMHSNMFSQCGGINLEKVLSDKGLTFDTSRVKDFGTMFTYSGITHLPEIDARNAANFNDTFLGSSIKSIRKLILSPNGNQNFGNSFFLPALEHIEIEGAIGNDIDFYACNYLEKESILSILSSLSSSVSSGKTCTLSKSAVDNAFEGFGYVLIDEAPYITENTEIVSGSNSYEWFMLMTNYTNTHSNWNIILA